MSGDKNQSPSELPDDTLPGIGQPCAGGSDFAHFSDMGHTEFDAAIVASDIDAAQAHYGRAVEHYRKAAALCTFTADHPERTQILYGLAFALQQQGEHEQAVEVYRNLIATYEDTLGATHPDLSTPCFNLAVCLNELGETQESLTLAKRALTGFENAPGPDHPDTISCRRYLADTLCDLRAYALAEPLHRENLLAMERIHGTSHPDVLPYCMFLAMCLEHLDKTEEALALARRAANGFMEIHGEQHPDTELAEDIADLMESSLTTRLGWPQC